MNYFEKHQKAYEIRVNTPDAKPGDKITAMGITCTIAKIYYQSLDESDRNDDTCDWDIEFEDTHGVYRHWKQYFDGGQLIAQ